MLLTYENNQPSVHQFFWGPVKTTKSRTNRKSQKGGGNLSDRNKKLINDT